MWTEELSFLQFFSYTPTLAQTRSERPVTFACHVEEQGADPCDVHFPFGDNGLVRVSVYDLPDEDLMSGKIEHVVEFQFPYSPDTDGSWGRF